MRYITAYLFMGAALLASACSSSVDPQPLYFPAPVVGGEGPLSDPLFDDDEPIEAADSHSETETIRDLCEPENDRRPYPTEEQKQHAKRMINKTCRAMGVSPSSCTYFRLVSTRESSYRWWVRHKMPGDTAAAMNGYLSAAYAYGWEAIWPYSARRQEDLSKLELIPRSDNPNPYYPDVERWLTGGLGLGGLNVGYHLRKIDPNAPPEILCDPVLNTMVQITIARRAVKRYGAKNWIQVQSIYAGRTRYNEKGKVVPAPDVRADRAMKKRCVTWGLDCHATPQLGKKLNLDRMAPEEIYEAADKIRGAPLPPFDAPESDSVAKIHAPDPYRY